MTPDEWVSAERLLATTGILLGLVGILLAIGGVIAYVDVRRKAASIAREEAHTTAEVVSEAAAVAYLQRELPAMIGQYAQLARGSVEDDQATDVANRQDNGGAR